MSVQSNSIVLLLAAAALGAGVVERDRIFPPSTQPKAAVQPSPPVPPVRPEIETTASITPPASAVARHAACASPRPPPPRRRRSA